MKELDRVLEVIHQLPHSYIDEYDSWVKVGMVLKDLGGNLSMWENWSRSSSKYNDGECEKKWRGFGSHRKSTSVGTVMDWAKECNVDIPPSESSTSFYVKPDKKLFKWDYLSDAIIDTPPLSRDGKIDLRELKEDIISYAHAMFDPEETVWYNQNSRKNDEKYIPEGMGNCCLAKDLHKKITRHESDSGIWVRINPMNNEGIKDDNVTDFRYALVESDSMAVEKQVAVYEELQLPIKALVHSGGKSAHAIVKVDAGTNYDLYQERVDYLYDVLSANGMDVDRQNRNPSRLSRLPGVMRGENAQYLLAVDIGKESWTAWHHYIELMNDNMPPLEDFCDFAENVPEKAEEIIQGLVRRGHKMSISSASKAGKTFLIANMSLCLATGSKWLSMQCTKSKVLICNFEVSRESFENRLIDVSEANGIKPERGQLMVWNLRGKPCGLKKFVPKLLRKIKDIDFDVIILDPSYKILEGDENSAKDVTEFVNLFDVITEESGCTLITIGHYSKGKQGAKAAQDRQSGSGVLARDPDAIVTLTPLEEYPDIFRMEFDLREFKPRKPIDVEKVVVGEGEKTVIMHQRTTQYQEMPIVGTVQCQKKNEELCKKIIDRIISFTIRAKNGICYLSDIADFAGIPCDKVKYVMENYNSKYKLDGSRIERK